MKFLLQLFFFVCVYAASTITVSGQSSSYSKELSRKTNVIILLTDTTAEANYMNFGRHLIERGYVLANTNKDFLTFSTEYQDAPWSTRYNIDVSFVNNEIRIRPNFIRSDVDFDWKYGSQIGKVVYKEIIDELMIYEGEIFYSIQN